MSDVVTSFETSFESRGFLWLVILGSAGGIALTVANAIEYNRAKTDCNSVSRNTANVLLWLNIILAVILAIIFIWAIYRLLVHPKTRGEIVKKSSGTALKVPPGSTIVHTSGTPGTPGTTHILPSNTQVVTSGALSGNVVYSGTQQSMLARVSSDQ